MSMTEADIWQRLGIEPTQDRAVIRRAYAAQLRGIDQDKDPVSFIMLRDALTLALRTTPGTTTTPIKAATTRAATVTVEPEAGMPPPELPPERAAQKAKAEAAGQTFMAAAQAGRTENAFLAYQALVATGAISLGAGIHPAAVQLGLLAVRDKNLAMMRVNAILHALGLDAVTLDRLKDHREIAEIIMLVTHRSAAERWLQVVELCANRKLASWNGIRQRRRIITARYMLGTWPTKFLVRSKALETEMKFYDQFSVWVETRLKMPGRLDKARREKELSSLQRVQSLTQAGWIGVYIGLLCAAGAAFGSNAVSFVVFIMIGINLARRFTIQTRRG